jgi:TPR repeat protein
MHNPFARSRLTILLSGALVAAGCASSGTSSRPSAAPPAAAVRGTLGIETGPISRQIRKRLTLAPDTKGAIVVEVLPGGPGAVAGIRVDDVVEQVGAFPIANDCDFVDAGYNLPSLSPVGVSVRRAKTTVELKLAPVEQGPFFEELCGRAIASGCYRQAWSLGTAERQRERALALYQTACKADSASGCADLGIRLLQWTDRRDETIAAVDKSCTLGSGAGCAHEAFLYATGKLVGRDDRRATALYVRGCDLGDAKACYNVGVMADEGRGAPRNLKTAAARYEEACEGGSSAACTNLGFLYENGHGVARDRELAVAFYQRGCDGSHCQPSNRTGCVNLGRTYRDGIGVAKDPARAMAIFQDACDRPLDPEDIGADRNRSRACSLLGAMYLGTDDAKGRELSELGCERGDGFGCFNAAAIYTSGSGVAADPVKATSFLEKACRAGDGEGCFDLAIAYEKGSGTSADPAKATESFQKACELGFQKACARKGR